MKEQSKMSLEEATIKNLYNQLDDTEEFTDVTGIVDDVLVITDPEISSDEYDEVIERAQEIVEDTPEGEIPLDDEFLGQYILTCPNCGNTFVSKDMLEPGATCPICLETPEAFVARGKLENEEDVVNDSKEPKDKEETEVPIPVEDEEEPTEESVEEEGTEQEELEASEQVKTASNKLQENTKLQESDSEDTVKQKIREYINDDYHRQEDFTDLEMTEETRDKINDLVDKELDVLTVDELNKMSTELNDTQVIDLEEYGMIALNRLDEGKKVTEDYSNGIVYTIKFNTSTAAFDDYGEGEVNTVLDKLAEKIKEGDTEGSVLDSNGNQCLTFTSEEEIVEESKKITEDESKAIKSALEALKELEVSNFEELDEELHSLWDKEIIDDDQYDDFKDISGELSDECILYITKRSQVTNTDYKDELVIEEDYVQSAIDKMIKSLGKTESKELKTERRRPIYYVTTEGENGDVELGIYGIDSNTVTFGYSNGDGPFESDIYKNDSGKRCFKDEENYEWTLDEFGIDDSLNLNELDVFSESKKLKTEEISVDEVTALRDQIEDAEDMDEIQDIIYSISDGVLEDEVQHTYDECVRDEDDIDAVKSFVLQTLEDNAEYLEESRKVVKVTNIQDIVNASDDTVFGKYTNESKSPGEDVTRESLIEYFIDYLKNEHLVDGDYDKEQCEYDLKNEDSENDEDILDDFTNYVMMAEETGCIEFNR